MIGHKKLRLVLSHRKASVLIFLLVTMVMATVPSVRAQIANYVVINEFELNPPGDDYAAGNEFVELYNPTSASVNIGGWRVSTTHGTPVTVTIPAGTSISAKGYYVVTHSTQWLDNEDESIVLRDAAGNEIDRTPVKSDPYDDARSWQRNPDGKDTNTDADWVFQTSTRGAPIPEFPSASIILAVTFLAALIISRKWKKLVIKENQQNRIPEIQLHTARR